MEMNEIIEQAKANIRQAVEDYRRHTDQTKVLDDVSEKFINRLAVDSSYAKQELREMFSRSPAWDSKLDALVINGTRTHNPDYSRIMSLSRAIFQSVYHDADCETRGLIREIERFFAQPDNQEAQEDGIKAITKIAPEAYVPGKKLSRVFKAICVQLGIADETAGSEFQRLFAQFADELNAKKISFKLYASINPAHFITMSNPKCDDRGSTLTSCHSFNSTEYAYNSGCTGYARDKYSFIVFTAADPADPETLNNRKTTRQIFAYKPGNGLLLQSRFYNTSGGTRGAQEESPLYRDLIQREISAIEGVPNLWKTYPYVGHGKEHLIKSAMDFGGYPDWIYDEFDAKVSIRSDCEDSCESLKIGTLGICVCCADETNYGVYCHSCEPCEDLGYCYDCEDECSEDELCTVYDRHGIERLVCQFCRDEQYRCCERCGEYHFVDNVTYVEDAEACYCDGCLEDLCECCVECGEYYLRMNMNIAVDSYGDEVRVCDNCIDEYD